MPSILLTISPITLHRKRDRTFIIKSIHGGPIGIHGPRYLSSARKYVDFVIHLYQPFYQLFFAGDGIAPSMSTEYHGDQSVWWERSDWVYTSMFEVPLTDSGSMFDFVIYPVLIISSITLRRRCDVGWFNNCGIINIYIDIG